ncbi:MAG: hypothetical protein ACXVD0_04210, partial [Nocardioides sp.]
MERDAAAEGAAEGLEVLSGVAAALGEAAAGEEEVVVAGAELVGAPVGDVGEAAEVVGAGALVVGAEEVGDDEGAWEVADCVGWLGCVAWLAWVVGGGLDGPLLRVWCGVVGGVGESRPPLARAMTATTATRISTIAPTTSHGTERRRPGAARRPATGPAVSAPAAPAP